MPNFYSGQTDYIGKLNELATATEIAGISSAVSSINGNVSAAAASAAQAATSYDDFDDRYLGSKATNPTLDNDGLALLTAAIYWNTAVPEMRVWSGTAWVPVQSTSAATQAAASAATASTQASNAAGSATTASTQATNASASATTASTQATNASGSATTASTQATNAAGSATTASTQASNASTSATNAGTQATSASSSAGNASTQANNAGTSAGSASSSAAQSAASRDLAIQAWGASTAPSEALSAISKTIHNGAIVKAIIYDTNKDSDGGAWRKRCQDKSWFTETLGGTTWLGQATNELAARGDNLLGYSEQLDNAAWASFNGASVVANTGLGFDNTTTADTVTFISASSVLRSNLPALPAGLYVFSVWAEKLTGTGNLIVDIGDNPSVTKIATTTPTRFEFLLTKATNSWLDINSDAAGSFRLWGAKLNVVGALPSTYSASPELVSNGNFDNGMAGWATSATGSSGAVSNSQLTVTGTATNVVQGQYATYPCVIGKTYRVSIDLISASTTNRYLVVSFGSNAAGTALSNSNFVIGANFLTFVATGTTHSVHACVYNTGDTIVVDNISVKEVTTLATPYVPYSALVNSYYQNTTDNKFYSLSATYGQTEVFRGNVREFPEQVAIIIESARLLIYDLTQLGCPMWIVFKNDVSDSTSEFLTALALGLTSVAAMNGILLVSGSNNTTLSYYGHLRVASFVADTMRKWNGAYNNNYTSLFGIANRNGNIGFSPTTEVGAVIPGIVDGRINDIAITVLDNAPIDSVTGLPMPTIAVATAGGVSVIKDDNTVVNKVLGSATSWAVAFKGPVLLVGGISTDAWNGAYTWNIVTNLVNNYGRDAVVSLNPNYGNNPKTIYADTVLACGVLNKEFRLVKEMSSAPNKSLLAVVNNSVTTGWQIGDARATLLADTVVESVVGEQAITGDSSTFLNSVGAWKIPVGGQWRQGTLSGINGRLTATNPPALTVTSATWSAGVVTIVTSTPHNYQSGESTAVSNFVPSSYSGFKNVSVVNATTLTYPLTPDPGVVTTIGSIASGAVAELQFVTTPGKRYVLQYINYVNNFYSVASFASAGSGGNIIGQITVSPGIVKFEFLAISATTYLNVYKGQTPSEAVQWSNFTCGLAQSDRSVKAIGIIVNGTLTKTTVATGAQLVAYSGWSAANYAQQSFNSNLEFGTGEWDVNACVNFVYPRINLLIKTEQLSDGAVWSRSNGTVIDNATADETGVLRLANVSNTPNVNTYIAQPVALLYNTTYTRHVVAKFISGASDLIFETNNNGVFTATSFNLVNGTATGTGVITPLGNGLFKCSYTFTTASSGSLNAGVFYIGAYGSTALATTLAIGKPQIEASATATTYQRVNTATDFGTEGVIADRSALSGPSIRLSQTSGFLKATVFDGTTTRTVTSPNAISNGLQTLANATYRTDGSLALNVNGFEVARTLGTPLLTLNSSLPRHNLLTNNTLVGTVAGTPGTFPNTWGGTFVSLGLSQTVIGTGVENGIEYIDIRIFGTSNATGFPQIQVGSAAVVAGPYTQSQFVKLVGGTVANIVRLFSAPVVPGQQTVIGFVPTGNALNTQRFNATATATSSGTGSAIVGFEVGSGAVVDITLRIGGQQFEAGSVMTTYQRVVTTTDYDTTVSIKASLTVGNSRTLDAPFPGTITLLRVSATAPSADQSAFIYRTELPLFAPGAQCTIDGTSTSVTAMAYDDNTEVLHVGTSWGRTAFRNLLRVESAPTTMGAITSLAANQGAHVTAGANAGRYYQPALLLRDELRRQEEARKALGKIPVFTEYDAVAAQTVFLLPKGYTVKAVYLAGTLKRIGSTKDYTITNDGFVESIVFAVSPGAAAWVSIMSVRS